MPGLKVRVANVSGGQGYTYTGGVFRVWHDVYDVISVAGDRVVIGVGSAVTAAVNVSDLEVVT